MIQLSAYDSEHKDEKIVIQCDAAALSSNEVKRLQKKLGIVIPAGRKNGAQDCIGIDLGTTTSELTHCNRTGDIALQALNNPEPVGEKDLAYSSYCFPSVVYYKNGTQDIQVANTAAVNAMGAADECFDTFKIKDRYKPVGEIDGKPVMVRDLSALLLSKIWRSAQDEMPVPPSSAVITVPAAFNFDECQDTYNAAVVAGIEKITLIDEPTAAFYYYKHIQEIDLEDVRNVLVFDFGGGTADVAILDVQADALASSDEYKDCIYKVLATCGDTHCGGRNVDEMLVNEVCKRFEAHTGYKVSAANMRELRRKVEAAKIELSEKYRENACE